MIRAILVTIAILMAVQGFCQPGVSPVNKRYAELIPGLHDSLIVYRYILNDSMNLLVFPKAENQFLKFSYHVPVDAIHTEAPSDFLIKMPRRRLIAEYAVLSNSIAGHRIGFVKRGRHYWMQSIYYYQYAKNGQEWICRIRFRISGKSLKIVTLLAGSSADCKTLGEPPPEEQAILDAIEQASD